MHRGRQKATLRNFMLNNAPFGFNNVKYVKNKRLSIVISFILYIFANRYEIEAVMVDCKAFYRDFDAGSR